MRMFIRLACVLAAISCIAAFAARGLTAQRAPTKTGLPPLIDRELFFGDPEIAAARLSPDGRFIAFLKPFKGTRNIWVKGVNDSFVTARAITAETGRPIPAYFWSRDGKFILFVQDHGGDENFNVYAVNPSAPAGPGSDVPAARNITDLKGVRVALYAVPKSDPDTLYVGLNDRDKAWHDLYRVRISTGERTLLRRNTERLARWTFDTADKLRLAVRSAENGDTEILRVDETGFTKIYACSVFESCDPVHFHKDGRRVYMASNRSANFTRLTLLDVQSKMEDIVESDPLNRVDLQNAIFSDRTDDLIATVYVDDKRRMLFKNAAFEADYNLVKQKLPGKEIGFGSSTTDERLFMVGANSDVDPGETYLFDRQTKKLTFQYRIRERLPRESLAPMTPVRYPSSDGLDIPAYLTLPKGVEPRALPLVVLPHGGPWARDAWGYDALAQFLANRGYAVLQPNFRASTGYGKRFLDAGNKQWGDKMQDDLTWGVKYPRRKRDGRSEAGRHLRRIVRRLRHARGRRVHARSVRGRGFLRRAVESHHAAQGQSAVLGSWSQDVRGAHRQPGDARGPRAARTAVAAQLGSEDQDATARDPGRERSASEQGRVRTDCHRAARPWIPGRVHPRARRGSRLCATREQHGCVLRGGEVPGKASRRAISGDRDARSRRASEGTARRSRDGRASRGHRDISGRANAASRSARGLSHVSAVGEMKMGQQAAR